MLSLTSIMNGAFIYMAVLFIAAMSGLISEKAGIVNIAINGMMIIGALAFRIFGNVFHGYDYKWTIIFATICAMLLTGIFALLHGLATITFKADHVISGTAINLLASGIALFASPLLAKKLGEQGDATFHTVYIFKTLGTTNLTPLSIVYFAVSLAIAIKIFIYFRYTKIGVRHAAVGENPNAVDSAAINVIKYKWLAVLGSGMLAGLAGSIALAKIGQFTGNIQGLGFVALAIMILGQWRVDIIFISSIVFSFIWGYISYEKTLFGLPENVAKMIPFILSLVTLVFLSKYQASPKAVGQHFDKSKR